MRRFGHATSPEVSHAPVRLINTDVLGPLRPMADFQYILPGAIGLPQGSNLYLWNPHIICGRSSMRQRTPGPSPRCDVASREWACIFTPRWLPGVVLSTRGSNIARQKLLSRVITMVQVRSLGMAEVANGGHITVRSEPCWPVLNLPAFPLRLQPRD